MCIRDSNNHVKINDFSFRFYNPVMRKDALSMRLRGDVDLAPGPSGSIKITQFRFLKEPLITMVPDKFRKMLTKVPVKKPVDMNMDLYFSLGKVIKAKMGMLLKVPDYDLNDLKLALDLNQDTVKQRINLKKFYFGSRALNLHVNAGGRVDMKRAPISDSDLRLSVKMDYPEMKKAYGPWQMAGLMELKAHMKGDMETGIAGGSLKFDKFNVQNKEMKLAVQDLNMDFPFNYSFKLRKSGKSYISVRKSQLIDNDNFREKPNFSIKSIRSKHPARDISFEYLKDFEAFMAFRDNVFEISNMKAYVLDGSLYGKQILFNMADLKPDNMEYRLILDATNIDINKLDDPDPKKKTRDAELSMSSNFSGRGVNVKRKINAKGYINIHKVGKKFANKLMKGLSEEKGKSKLGIVQPVVDNSMSISGFNFSLEKGLVYTTVSFSRRVFSLFATVENSQVKFDRIPIQEYLRKVRKGE